MKIKQNTTDNVVMGLAIAGVVAMSAIMLLSRNPPILSDYVDWTYQGVLLRNVLLGQPDSAYLLKHYAVPNSLTSVGLGLLMLMLPWKVAAKVWLSFGFALGLFGGYKLQRATGERQNWQLLVVAATAVLGVTFWCGFTNFLFGLYFVMLFCALLLKGYESRWVYALLLVLIFFCHMIPFGFAVFVLGLYALQTKLWAMVWQAVPAFLLCVWYFMGLLLHGNADAKTGIGESVPYMTPLFAAFRVHTFLKCWGMVNISSTFQDSIFLRLVGAKVFCLMVALDAVVAAAALVLLWRGAREAIPVKTGSWFFWVAVSVFFVVSLVMPLAAAGISDPGGRMLQIAVWCGICVVKTRQRWTAAVLCFCAAVLIASSCYQMSRIGLQPLMVGTTTGPVPGVVRKFAHVTYDDKVGDYDCLDRGTMTCEIWPTALFLNRPVKP